ncbi:MAG: acetyl-CoA carboxylase biotin carboxyl carrier protein [SAR324 cluster bacterium]|uniref:Biotin carboxyl carrier protein of acetyl-CoA carboxylase n=1 Tax=SAR324 cluster bacterium TaxID=2024889 RepID=A0A7X9FSG7_9DELT|nr:acetyl-CoA carboxylase biotin carboxyl carrier protein [SAR324 cluster bacterium]
MDTKELEKILRILKENDVHDFELENEGVRLRLSRGAKEIFAVTKSAAQSETVPLSSGQPYFIPAVAASPADDKDKEEALPQTIVPVESPIVGTFYSKPSPDAEPFVSEGQAVKRGQTLCIIEAMKIMNEIESPCNGKIVKILLGDGQVVEYGERLFLIDTAA